MKRDIRLTLYGADWKRGQTDDENAMITDALAFLRDKGLRIPAMRSGSRSSEQTLIREIVFGVLADPRDLETLIQRSRYHGVPLRTWSGRSSDLTSYRSTITLTSCRSKNIETDTRRGPESRSRALSLSRHTPTRVEPLHAARRTSGAV